MTSLPDHAGWPIDSSRWQVVNRLLQAGIVAGLVAGIHRRDSSVIINGLLALLFALLPRSVKRRTDVRVRLWQQGWFSMAGLVHTLGMLGPYDEIWWWDQLAHTLSGAVVAGAVDVVYRSDGKSDLQACSRPAFVAGITFAFGVVWEFFEYLVHTVGDRIGVDPLLVQYGRVDGVGDLFFDLFGAALVIQFGQNSLSNFIDADIETEADQR